MYERFTDRARKIMQLANQEAQRLNHEYIGTEHILLGLVKEGSGIAADALKNLHIDLRRIRLEIEKIVQSGPDAVSTGKLPQTPRARKVIEYAIEEARNLNDGIVGTRHILLGLLREEEGVAAQVLINLGLMLDHVREEILAVVGNKDRSAKCAAPKILPKSPDENLSTLPPETQESVRELDDAIAKLHREKEEAVAVHDFVKAAMLRDRSDSLRKERQSLIRKVAAATVIPRIPTEDLSSLAPEIQNSVRELDAAIDQLNREKEEAVAANDFEKAAWLRDRADQLKKKRQSLTRRGPA